MQPPNTTTRIRVSSDSTDQQDHVAWRGTSSDITLTSSPTFGVPLGAADRTNARLGPLLTRA
jgi:hypothetical protein